MSSSTGMALHRFVVEVGAWLAVVASKPLAAAVEGRSVGCSVRDTEVAAVVEPGESLEMVRSHKSDQYAAGKNCVGARSVVDCCCNTLQLDPEDYAL